MKQNNYAAHRNADGNIQTLNDHLLNTAALARKFASAFCAEEEAYAAGLVHDIGKSSDQFQKRLFGANVHTDHSTAGALEMFKRKNPLLAACVAGHHSGLPDMGSKFSVYGDGTLFGRIKAKPGTDIEPYDNIVEETDFLPSGEIRAPLSKQEAFLRTKMLYSALTDADFLDTERFMDKSITRQSGCNFESLLKMFLQFVSKWDVSTTEIGERRNTIRHSVADKAVMPSGMFTLTVPTGGGKTVTSMEFALRHAVLHNKQRIIYVVPYTTIIEQTQKVFEEIFGAENVLAHYASADYMIADGEDEEEADVFSMRRLAAENWDVPIVITTSVQFFESFFSCRSSKCRKLHNVSDSVIIFDEVQMLPTPVMRPCLYVVSQLVKNYKCSAVFCTATQPSLERILMEDNMLGARQITELCPEPKQMYEAFRRVTYKNAGTLPFESISDRLSEVRQVLCIVNKKQSARELFEMLPEDGRFHLSTLMTPHDRRKTLETIRKRLESGEVCRVVSTSLVEAGVDVDFPTVYRELNGIDSIIQAGGRCNREGKRPINDSTVYFFLPQGINQPKYLAQNACAAERVIRDHDDISSPEAVKAYFDFLLYSLKGEMLDEKGILKMISENPMNFRSIEAVFRMIDDENHTVIIPCEENEKILDDVRRNGICRNTLRRLGFYSVNLPKYSFDNLRNAGCLEKLPSGSNAAILTDLNRYSSQCGLCIDKTDMQALIW